MNPAVEAAIIAGSVGVLTLIGTLAAQFYGIRRTSKDTLNARFATAADKLGSEAPAVRLAGVYAMAALADDWPENRQTCVDVLCGYLRMPYEPDQGEETPEPERLAFRASREVRHTVIRVITAHLKDDATVSWQGINLDFTGVVFDGGDFTGAKFSGGEVSFIGAEFVGGKVDFRYAEFSGGVVDFEGAEFSGGEVSFRSVRFSGGVVSFVRSEFSGGAVTFYAAKFSGGTVWFSGAQFSGGAVSFSDTKFSGGKASFIVAEFSGGEVDFSGAKFSGGEVDFSGAEFSGATVSFREGKFSGGEVSFLAAKFPGGEVDFSDPGDWSAPPRFTWIDIPPQGVKLPRKEDPSAV